MFQIADALQEREILSMIEETLLSMKIVKVLVNTRKQLTLVGDS